MISYSRISSKRGQEQETVLKSEVTVQAKPKIEVRIDMLAQPEVRKAQIHLLEPITVCKQKSIVHILPTAKLGRTELVFGKKDVVEEHSENLPSVKQPKIDEGQVKDEQSFKSLAKQSPVKEQPNQAFCQSMKQRKFRIFPAEQSSPYAAGKQLLSQSPVTALQPSFVRLQIQTQSVPSHQPIQYD